MSIILPVSVICSVNAQQIMYPGYVSYYNPLTLIPDSVIWSVTPHHRVAKRLKAFHSTAGRPNLKMDYHKSGYDIGHNCDASDENGNVTDEYNSFDFANTFPQLPALNRVTWLALENHCRALAAAYGPVKIKAYWSGVAGHIGKNNVTIPTYCIKETWYSNAHEKYIIPNNDTVTRHPYNYYLVHN